MKDNEKPSRNFDTLCVHAGEGVDSDTRAIRRPIHMANSYELSTDLTELLEQVTYASLEKFNYTRQHNPTVRHLEERLALLEGGEDCIVSASGMGAISAALFTLLAAGDHIVASEVCYTGTQKLIGKMLPKFGIEVSMIDTSNIDEVRQAVGRKTKAVYIETPANPLVLISDIRAIADIAHNAGAMLIVDSTWSGLVNQRPLGLGADIVIHSATKYINGHGDSLGGAIIGPCELLKKMRDEGITLLGSCISPFNAWLILRGSVTLPLRMQRHSVNAQKVAEFLSGHPKVDMLRYPGLKNHPSYELAKAQMKTPSGMLNFNLKADIMEHFKFLDRLNLITHAVSLGHDQSLIYYLPTGFFFEEMAVFNDAQKLKYLGLMGEGIFRLSVGIEEARDIIADLKQALEGVNIREGEK